MSTRKKAREIMNAINTHVQTHDKTYAHWCCGISADPMGQLVKGHNAVEKENFPRCWDVGSEELAQQVVQFFKETGCKNSAGRANSAYYVYIYRILLSTWE